MGEKESYLNAKELYNQAYRYNEAGDRKNLLKTCQILLDNFPNSKEAKWATKNFKLIPTDIPVGEVPIVSGRFRKVKIKQIKGYGLYHGQGSTNKRRVKPSKFI